eukprot:TRINITY_DN12214_c0_g1_i1.p1 TRINITY_DN12214_c0_g1~~TRINITY_DN12214_c0_g1_i1.p1  ORF type:complete len:396 (+),score=33.43 TRINITY_DN12214_c0_g1_i1:101-1288(+)
MYDPQRDRRQPPPSPWARKTPSYVPPVRTHQPSSPRPWSDNRRLSASNVRPYTGFETSYQPPVPVVQQGFFPSPVYAAAPVSNFTGQVPTAPFVTAAEAYVPMGSYNGLYTAPQPQISPLISQQQQSFSPFLQHPVYSPGLLLQSNHTSPGAYLNYSASNYYPAFYGQQLSSGVNRGYSYYNFYSGQSQVFALPAPPSVLRTATKAVQAQPTKTSSPFLLRTTGYRGLAPPPPGTSSAYGSYSPQRSVVRKPAEEQQRSVSDSRDTDVSGDDSSFEEPPKPEAPRGPATIRVEPARASRAVVAATDGGASSSAVLTQPSNNFSGSVPAAVRATPTSTFPWLDEGLPASGFIPPSRNVDDRPATLSRDGSGHSTPTRDHKPISVRLPPRTTTSQVD